MIDFFEKEVIMGQLHKRFSNEQVKLLLEGYVQSRIARAEVEGILEINKTRFFALVKEYRLAPGTFSLDYQRETPARLSPEVEAARHPRIYADAIS